MSFFAWRDELSVGNAHIDGDHKKLIELLNELQAAMAKGQGKEVIGSVLGRLIAYTQEHFRREEEHMRRVNYPEYATHKHEHDELVRQVLELQGKLNAGSITLSVQVMAFLRDWLTSHIMQSDKKMVSVAAPAHL